MLAARGWDVTVEFFSGMSKHTDLVVQTSRGVIGKVTVGHGPDFHGVVLVDPETGVGCANLDLGSVARPGPDGQWQPVAPGAGVGHLGARAGGHRRAPRRRGAPRVREVTARRGGGTRGAR
jgi:hypothetical protein